MSNRRTFLVLITVSLWQVTGRLVRPTAAQSLDGRASAFVKSIGIYPVGTLVKLESGRLGVVVEQGEKSLLAPKVKVFFSTKSTSYIPPQVLDLAGPGLQDKIVGREDAAKWGLKNVNDFWVAGA